MPSASVLNLLDFDEKSCSIEDSSLFIVFDTSNKSAQKYLMQALKCTYFQNCVLCITIGSKAKEFEDIIDWHFVDLNVANEKDIFVTTAAVSEVHEAVDLINAWSCKDKKTVLMYSDNSSLREAIQFINLIV